MNRSFSKSAEDSMRRRLAPKPEIFEHLRPTYPVACRRVSPGPRYLECLVDDKLVFIPKGIKSVTRTGIIDEEGVNRDADAIICATGFDTYVRLCGTSISMTTKLMHIHTDPSGLSIPPSMDRMVYLLMTYGVTSLERICLSVRRKCPICFCSSGQMARQVRDPPST